MSILKALFGGKKEEPKVTVQFQAESVQKVEAPLKKVSASVQDLVLLSIAEDYRVGETKYPDFFRSRFGIGFPNEVFKELEKNGMIRPSSPKESLPHMKASELKAIATKIGVKTSGKKEEICARIAENASEDTGLLPKKENHFSKLISTLHFTWKSIHIILRMLGLISIHIRNYFLVILVVEFVM